MEEVAPVPARDHQVLLIIWTQITILVPVADIRQVGIIATIRMTIFVGLIANKNYIVKASA